MEFERWDDQLVAEHELIERAMAVLKSCLEDLDAVSKKPLRMLRALDFLLEFGDKIHNRKEEDFLFPAMNQRGVPIDGGPLGVMLQEHTMERELVAWMMAEAKGLVKASEEDRQEYRQKGLEYLKIRAEHIWKENDILYPMARQVISDEDATGLLSAFQVLDQETYGDDAHGHFRTMAEECEAGGMKDKGLVHNLSREQLHGILETMPFEVTFVDANDVVAYFNRLDKEKLFPRTRSVIGRKVEKCHPEGSVHMVRTIVEGFKNKTRDKAEFWIDFRGTKVMIRYFPVYGDGGDYLGVLEVTQDIGVLQKIEGQKRLLD